MDNETCVLSFFLPRSLGSCAPLFRILKSLAIERATCNASFALPVKSCFITVDCGHSGFLLAANA